MAARTRVWRDLGRAAKVLSVGCRNMVEREGEMDWNEALLESSERNMTVSLIRVTACGVGRLDEFAIPYGMFLMPKWEEYVSAIACFLVALLIMVLKVCLITSFVRCDC